MFKNEGGGQRPFEQCSKKQTIWFGRASLSKGSVSKSGERESQRDSDRIRESQTKPERARQRELDIAREGARERERARGSQRKLIPYCEPKKMACIVV